MWFWSIGWGVLEAWSHYTYLQQDLTPVDAQKKLATGPIPVDGVRYFSLAIACLAALITLIRFAHICAFRKMSWTMRHEEVGSKQKESNKLAKEPHAHADLENQLTFSAPHLHNPK
jgi:hypothetical protein